MKRTLILAAAMGSLALAGGPALAMDAPTKASAQDGLFVRDAGQGGMTEIKTSEMVEDNSKDSDLRTFAKKMIMDHKMVQDKLSKAASDADVYMMSDFDKGHQMEVDMLRAASDADFAKTYLQIQDKEHRDAIYAFAMEAEKGTNPGLKQVAMEALPQLKQHRAMVLDLEKKMNVTPGTMASMADGQKMPAMAK